MLSYCFNCREDIESKDPKFVKTKNGRMIVKDRIYQREKR